jgi:hypothetical protein
MHSFFLLILGLLSGVFADRTLRYNLLNIIEIQVKERAIVAKMSLG